MEYEAIVPLDPSGAQWVFAAISLTTVPVACRLLTCLDLEPHGIALVVSLYRRIAEV